ncbi:XdhC family protein, partial [Cohnella lubricantis]
MDAYDVLRHTAESEEPAVLATVIGVEGHAYRKSGAMMLLLVNGGKVGSISPGCLESDLSERVPIVLESGEPEIVHYNMKPEEDIVWGETVGCGGKLRILLEPVAGELRMTLREAYRHMEAGEAVRLVRRGAEPALCYALEAAGGNAAIGASSAGGDATESFYAVRLEPRPRLVMFGAGQDLDPIFAAAGRIGFRLAVADWRAGLLSADRFPGAELVSGTAAEIAAKLRLSSADYVIVCGHQLRKDREMLEMLLPIKPAYVGVMGSSSRIRL